MKVTLSFTKKELKRFLKGVGSSINESSDMIITHVILPLLVKNGHITDETETETEKPLFQDLNN